MTVKPTYEELERRVQELEKMESELEYSKEMLQVYEKASLGYQSLDKNGHYLTVNQTWLNTLGYAKEEVIGKSFADFIHPDWQHHFKENFSRFKSIGEILGAEFEMVKKNGDLIKVSLTGKISRDKKGGFHQTHCIFHDITQRKRTEEDLQKSEEQFRNLYDEAPVGYFEYDLQGNITRVNHTELKMLGYTSEEMIGQPCWKFIVDEAAREQIIAKLRGDRPPAVGLERTYRRKDGSTFPVLFQDRLLLDEDGHIKGIRTAIQDITERKQAEEELRKQLDFSESLIETAHTIILVLDPQGRIVRFNPYMEELLGYDLDEVKGRDWFETFIKQENDNTVKSVFLKAVDDIQTRGNVNPIIAKDGRVILVEWYDKTLKDKDGGVAGLLAIGQDITERKQAEAEREKLQAQLNQAQKMESIGSLAGGIAHDFNNLLFPIVGLSEMMLDDFPPGSMEHQNLHEIFQAGKRGRELVQQILSFSRQSEQHPIPVHIQKILKEAIKLCRATIPADITINRDIQIDSSPVMADPTQIHQIAMNLITNAFHAVEPAGGTITVKLKEVDFSHEDDPGVHLASGRYAVLSVSDTGTGIDPAIINKIFDPYFTTKEKGRGTGLGLATVYGIVKIHGGDIRVHSEIGKGSSFHVYLPLMEKAQESDPEKEMIPHPTGTGHILLVDDEKPIVHLEKQMLERLGYSITCFSSSVDALAAFKTDPSRFDLVITDMNMPNLNGMQLAEKLTAIRSDIPVIICTGFSERINKENSAAKGVRGLLMKPVVMKDLAQKVREVLD